MKTTTYKLIGFGLLASMLSACGSNSDSNPEIVPAPEPPAPVMMSFDVSVSNITNAQPLSPVALIAHDGSFQAWAIGEAAGAGLEVLAESGSPADLIAEADAASVYMTAAGADVIMPGAGEMLALSFEEQTDAVLSVATMLVNTNDAFIGAQNVDLSQLAVGDSVQLSLPVYDAGTEANSETAASIPGPAAMGEGFNADRDDVDYVSRHPGVVTSSDGYSASALTEAHRFDSPAARITITRTE